MDREITQIKFNVGISTNILPQNNLLEAVSVLSTFSNLVELEVKNDSKIILKDSESYNNIIKSLLKLKQSRDLKFSVHAPHKGYKHNLASGEENIRNSFCETIKQIIEFSYDIGANIVTCHPGYVDTKYPQFSSKNLSKSLSELSPYAEKRKINLCLENMGMERGNCLILSPKKHIELCQKTNTWLTLDIVHLISYLADINLLEISLSKLLPYIKNIHLADMLFPKHSHIPLGKGNLPILRILKYLSDNNYRGNLVIDAMGGSKFFSNQYIEQFYYFIKRIDL